VLAKDKVLMELFCGADKVNSECLLPSSGYEISNQLHGLISHHGGRGQTWNTCGFRVNICGMMFGVTGKEENMEPKAAFVP
jgi:hypothetical protein